MTVASEAELAVVLIDDYLQAELAQWNREALNRRQPWLLVAPGDAIGWIGPIFRPNTTGCWECLAQRLRWNRPLDLYLADTAWKRPPLTWSDSSLETVLGLAASEAARWLNGGESILEGAVITVEPSSLERRHHVLTRRPQCGACGAPNEYLKSDKPSIKWREVGGGTEDTSKHASSGLECHISPITGIVSHVEPAPRAPEDHAGLLHTYFTGPLPVGYYANLERLLRHQQIAAGVGCGMTESQARTAALLEALERYSAVYQGYEPRERISYRALGGRAVHPNECTLFSEEQYRRRDELNGRGWWFQLIPEPFDEQRVIDWTALWSVGTDEWRYLPTGYCYFAYPNAWESACCRSDSNGNAAGVTLDDAIVRGFLELVERDAVALWWYNRLTRPAVDIKAFADPYTDALLALYQRLHRELWILDITNDFGIPTFAAISRRIDQKREDIILGFGCNFNPHAALLRALLELNQSLPSVTTIHAEGTVESNHDDASIAWWRTATVDNQPYLIPDPKMQSTRKHTAARFTRLGPNQKVRVCERLVRERGMEMLVLDLTRPDIGLPVAKVVVPGLRHYWQRLAPGRLYETPVRLGWMEGSLAEQDLNPFPFFL